MRLDALIGMLQYGYQESGRMPVAVTLAKADWEALSSECEKRGYVAVRKGGAFDPEGLFNVADWRPRIELQTCDGLVRIERDG